MGTLKTTNIQTITGSGTLTLGTSGETLALGSGVTSNLLYPAFEAKLSADQAVSDATTTKVQFDSEVLDTDNCYDNTTNYRFTPTTAGKYVFYVQVGFNSLGDQDQCYGSVYKNGSQLWTDGNALNLTSASSTSGTAVRYTITAEANGSSDYFEAYGRHNYGSNRNLTAGWCFFGGYKVIE